MQLISDRPAKIMEANRTRPWTLPERKLAVEIAVGLAKRLSSVLHNDEVAEHIGPGYVWHMCQSDFERGCDALWKLGAAVAAFGPQEDQKELAFPVADNEHGFPGGFRFFSADKIRKALSGKTPSAAPHLDTLLEVFIRVACNYGASEVLLSSRREPFVPHAEYAHIIEALERTGHIRRSGSTVEWMEKIAPVMQQAREWNADSQSCAAIHEENLFTECRAALDATPEMTRKLLAREAKQNSELGFVMILRDRFDGLYVKKGPDGTDWSKPYDIRLIKAIYKALRVS